MSRCYQSCCTGDEERIDARLLDERIVRHARKEHECVSCRQPIPVGATYIVQAAIIDGEFWASKTCPDCRWGLT